MSVMCYPRQHGLTTEQKLQTRAALINGDSGTSYNKLTKSQLNTQHQCNAQWADPYKPEEQLQNIP